MKRIHAYDGIKMIAILAIISYHLWPNVFSGGFLFVNTFLVLSGFLSAGKLEKITHQHDYTGVLVYLKKQIERLWIPLFWMIMIVVILLLFFNRSLLGTLRGDLLSSLFFSSNIYQLASQRSYFAEMAIQSPFTHLWYIAIHVQSFIVSVIIFILMNIRPLKKEYKAFIWMIIVVMSHLAFIFLYQSGADPTNVYYGFWTRYSSFASGILLYYFAPFFDNFMEDFSEAIKNTMTLVLSVLTFFMMLRLSFVVSDNSPLTYQVWLSYFNILSMVYILTTRQGQVLFERLFDNPVVNYFGQATYSHYLWYYPIIVWSSSFLRSFNHVIILQLLTYIAILLVSFVFYHTIERKAVHIPFGTQWQWRIDLQDVKNQPKQPPFIIFLVLVFLFIVGLGFSGNKKPIALLQLEYNFYQNQTNFGAIPYPGTKEMVEVKKQLEAMDSELKTNILKQTNANTSLTKALKQDPRELIKASANLSEENKAILAEVATYNPEVMQILNLDEVLFAATTPVTFFGDSLIQLSGYAFNTLFLEGNTYGYQSLQIWDSYPYLQALIDEGKLHENVVINMGTNAGLDDSGMQTLIELAGNRQIYLVNTNSAVEHKNSVNDVINRMVAQYPNVHLVDWHQYSQNHPEYFDTDDIHLSVIGMDEYSALVARTIKSVEE